MKLQSLSVLLMLAMPQIGWLAEVTRMGEVGGKVWPVTAGAEYATAVRGRDAEGLSRPGWCCRRR